MLRRAHGHSRRRRWGRLRSCLWRRFGCNVRITIVMIAFTVRDLFLRVWHTTVDATTAIDGLFGRRMCAGEQGGGVALHGEVGVWRVICIVVKRNIGQPA